jgi:hypothetical protein
MQARLSRRVNAKGRTSGGPGAHDVMRAAAMAYTAPHKVPTMALSALSRPRRP